MGYAIATRGRQMTAEYLFGFLKEPYELSGSAVEVRPVDDLDAIVKAVLASPSAGSAWFHPPLVQCPTERIALPAKRFELPVTHRLVTPGRPEDPEFGEFLVLLLGFMLGLRLTIRGTGHLQATPLRPGKLVSFLPDRWEVERALDKAIAFWDANTPEIRKLMFGAVHYFLVTQGYEHQHERFAWMYTVMDNLHRVAWHTVPDYARRLPLKSGHSQRPLALAAVFRHRIDRKKDRLPPPSFADPAKQAGNVDRLVAVRNELVHEARWASQPLGYAASEEGHDMYMELTFFCSQIILGVLGIDCEFRKAEYSRQVHGRLDMAP